MTRRVFRAASMSCGYRSVALAQRRSRSAPAASRPHRLVMTWTFDDDPSNEQLLELSLSESGSATTVLMVNSRISTDARRHEQAKGWQGCLDELDRLLAS